MASFDITTDSGAQQYLNSRIGSCISVERLSEGFSAWVYRATFEKPLSDGSNTAIVKHVQDHAARAFQIQLDASRLDYEERAMRLLLGFLYGEGVAVIQIPKVLDFDAETHTIMMSDAGYVPTLKSWLSGSQSPEAISQVGSTLATFLADVHDLSGKDPSTLSHFAGNVSGRQLSSVVYFGGLADAAARFGHTDPAIAEAGKQAAAEVLEASDVLTIGDFWTGNVLVDDEASRASGEDGVNLTAVDFELAKPGTAAFDVGQMAAEMYYLQKYRDGKNGKALLNSFLSTYAQKRDIDPAKVAIRVGAHFVIMGPMAWTAVAGEDAMKELVTEGAALVKAGWANDTEQLKASLVGPLYV